MSAGHETLLAGALLDGAVRATVSLGLATVISQGLATPRARHRLWTATLLLLPVWPSLAWWRGSWVDLDLGAGLVAMWAVGVGVGLIGLAGGLFALHLQVRAARRLGDRVWVSPRERGPYTWGAFRPVVLLPASSERWTPATRDAVLAHENAHIVRGDWFIHLLVTLCCVICWPHPMVWWARRRQQREAELAADARALRETSLSKTAYARALVAVARSRTAPLTGLSAASELSTRIETLLARSRRPDRRGWVALGVLAWLALAWVPVRPAPEIVACLPANPQFPWEVSRESFDPLGPFVGGMQPVGGAPCHPCSR
ncbi:MAG: M56 family metallopeptidase [Myxococcota bacterium]